MTGRSRKLFFRIRSLFFSLLIIYHQFLKPFFRLEKPFSPFANTFLPHPWLLRLKTTSKQPFEDWEKRNKNLFLPICERYQHFIKKIITLWIMGETDCKSTTIIWYIIILFHLFTNNFSTIWNSAFAIQIHRSANHSRNSSIYNTYSSEKIPHSAICENNSRISLSRPPDC